MPRPAPDPPRRWFEVDLTDSAVVVDEYADGTFTILVNDEPLDLSADQMKLLVADFVLIAEAKGWV